MRSIMLEKSVKIPLKALTTFRLVCQRENCGGVAEIPTSRLEALVGELVCPSCKQAFNIKPIGSIGGFRALGMVLNSFSSEEKEYKFEFIITETD